MGLTLAPPATLHEAPRDKLHLGCGNKILEGYVNVDIVAAPGVDLVWDVAEGIPYRANSFREIIAVDFVEHVPQPRAIHLMNEIHRVLVPGGIVKIHVPEAPGITAFQDPTHISFWNEETFTYYLDGHPRREKYGVFYGVQAKFKQKSLRRRRNLWTKFFTTFNFNYLANYTIDVELEAIK